MIIKRYGSVAYGVREHPRGSFVYVDDLLEFMDYLENNDDVNIVFSKIHTARKGLFKESTKDSGSNNQEGYGEKNI